MCNLVSLCSSGTGHLKVGPGIFSQFGPGIVSYFGKGEFYAKFSTMAPDVHTFLLNSCLSQYSFSWYVSLVYCCTCLHQEKQREGGESWDDGSFVRDTPPGPSGRQTIRPRHPPGPSGPGELFFILALHTWYVDFTYLSCVLFPKANAPIPCLVN